jgi:DnaK suppressor protein
MTRKKTSLDRERYDMLKQMLEDRRREIQDKLRSLRETLPAEVAEVRDAEEQSVDDFVQEVDFALMEMKSQTLSKIDEAIQRLDDGSYGVCAECGGEIAEARLAALPFAALCRSCQEQQEEKEAETRTIEARVGRDILPSLR